MPLLKRDTVPRYVRCILPVREDGIHGEKSRCGVIVIFFIRLTTSRRRADQKSATIPVSNLTGLIGINRY